MTALFVFAANLLLVVGVFMTGVIWREMIWRRRLQGMGLGPSIAVAGELPTAELRVMIFEHASESAEDAGAKALHGAGIMWLNLDPTRRREYTQVVIGLLERELASDDV